MSAVGGNYMSDGAIMAWVASQQNRLYGDLKSTMDLQERRAQMTGDLADIKKNIEIANRHPEKFPEAYREMQAFVDQYGDVPEFDELVATVREIMASVEKKLPGNLSAVAPGGSGSSLTKGTSDLGSLLVKPGAALPVVEKTDDRFADETIEDWMDTIDKKLDASGTNEQLGMIKINEIKSTIDQGTQMASQLIKSGNDSTNLILNNFV
jgi:hypothetical protein